MDKIRVVHTQTIMTGGAFANTLLSAAGLPAEKYFRAVVAGDGPMHVQAEGRVDQVIALPHLTRAIHPPAEPRALLEMTRALRRLKPHLVHTHNTKDGIYGRLAARLAGVPVVIRTYHGNFWQEWFTAARNYTALAIEMALKPLTDWLITVTQRDRQTLIALGLCRPEEVEVIYSGIDLQRFNTSVAPLARREVLPEARPDVPWIGMVAEFRPPKDQSTLLQALKLLAGQGLDFHVLFIGSGGGEEAARREARQLGLAERVNFLGHRHDVERWYRTLDLCATISHFEGLSRTIVEAMACGCPAVASHVGANDEVVRSGVNGWLVPRAKAAALAERLAWCLKHPAESRAIANHGAQSLPRHFDAAVMIRQLQERYEKLLAAKGVHLDP